MLIKQVTKNVYDVFVGVGFENWSRVRKMHWGLQLINGNKLPRTVSKEVFEALDNTKPTVQ